MSAITPAFETPFEALLGGTRVIPVITVPDLRSAVPLARALVAGGLPVLEVTLRTPFGLPAIAAIAEAVPEAIVGAGTVTTAQQLRDVHSAGSQFVVSPGCTEQLAQAAGETGSLFLPGAVTASEVMAMLDRGFTTLKFFPAQTSGGVEALKALSGPFADVRFCPTGGITLERSKEYLALPNVVAVGGTWMVTPSLVEAGDWDSIREIAAATAAATTIQ
jgi:2-dehydro-3-deoxyphosphogluconate aldolase/(4S)-4-hydroxy-2-oxoglutarate aldolase